MMTPCNTEQVSRLWFCSSKCFCLQVQELAFSNACEDFVFNRRLKLQKEKEDGGALDAAKERYEKGEIGFEDYMRLVFQEQKKVAVVLDEFIGSHLPR